MWKYLAIWLINLFWAVGPTPQIPAPSPSPTSLDSATNLIQQTYSWATLFSTLTDRALWLVFLFIILAVAWFIDRRKEKELQRYRDREPTLIATLTTVSELLERIERKLDHDERRR